MNLHPDVVKALSIFIDVDDIGDDGIRKQMVNDAFHHLKQNGEVSGFTFKFSIEERGWRAWFALVVSHSECLLRFSNSEDFNDNRWATIVIQRFREKNLEVHLPPVDKLTAEDLLTAVNAFLVYDVMDE